MKSAYTLFNRLLFLLVAWCFVAACSSPDKEETGVALGDTVQTESGLRYYYLTKGEGRKVEPGSKLSSYLSLKVNDQVIWTTDDSPDSVFTFIADVSSVIKGFNEMALLLREGDDVVAILPDSLAYGSRGAGDLIPPGATLVYDRFWVRKVDEPRAPMSDSLLAVYDRDGLDGLTSRYEKITKTADSVNYHTGEEMEAAVWQKLRRADRHEESLEVLEFFAGMDNTQGWRWNRVRTFESLERYQEAMDSLRTLIADDTTGWSGLQEKLEELESILASQ